MGPRGVPWPSRGVPWPSRGVPWPLYEEYVLELSYYIYSRRLTTVYQCRIQTGYRQDNGPTAGRTVLQTVAPKRQFIGLHTVDGDRSKTAKIIKKEILTAMSAAKAIRHLHAGKINFNAHTVNHKNVTLYF